eukprot:365535-Chlamydomonas_euryale.AAC.55
MVAFAQKVLKLLRSTEYAVRTFERAKLWRDAPQMYKGQIVPTQVQELLASPVVLPSPYLEQAVQGFQQTLENYRTVIGELEQALPADIMDRFGVGDDVSVAQALPLVISHMHDFFVHVAARMDKLHQEVQKCKDNFMTQRKAEGQFSDPFEDSRRYIQSHMTPGGTVKTGGTPGSTGKAGFGSQHAYRGAGMPGTPAGTPFNAVGGYTPGAAPTPFGTPFGGALSPAYDMSRNPMAATGRRRLEASRRSNHSQQHTFGARHLVQYVSLTVLLLVSCKRKSYSSALPAPVNNLLASPPPTGTPRAATWAAGRPIMQRVCNLLVSDLSRRPVQAWAGPAGGSLLSLGGAFQRLLLPSEWC